MMLDKYINHKITNIEAATIIGVSRGTFFRLVKEHKNWFTRKHTKGRNYRVSHVLVCISHDFPCACWKEQSSPFVIYRHLSSASKIYKIKKGTRKISLKPTFGANIAKKWLTAGIEPIKKQTDILYQSGSFNMYKDKYSNTNETPFKIWNTLSCNKSLYCYYKSIKYWNSYLFNNLPKTCFIWPYSFDVFILS